MSEQTTPAAAVASGEVTRVHEVSPALARALFGAAPPWVRDFDELAYEWRRLAAEFAGTLLLVLAGAGGGVVNALVPGGLGRGPLVVAPALVVMGVILATGAVSGAHLNPVVSIAFALRREFPWRRIPLYVAAQVAGAVSACALLWVTFGKVGMLGATEPGAHLNDPHAMLVEALLTFGLVTVILGTASGAQNVGPLSAVGVAGYIAAAGLWSSPLTGASMNPARSFGPEALTGDFRHFWVYLAGPTIGMLVAVGVAMVLRGRGGDHAAARAAQGTLGTLVVETHRVTGD
ncbi:MAG TPA: aquaporin [Acidimicrobiales bacterium]|nr:aquaporin [Acidimicrobiales bacterium]